MRIYTFTLPGTCIYINCSSSHQCMELAEHLKLAEGLKLAEHLKLAEGLKLAEHLKLAEGLKLAEHLKSAGMTILQYILQQLKATKPVLK